MNEDQPVKLIASENCKQGAVRAVRFNGISVRMLHSQVVGEWEAEGVARHFKTYPIQHVHNFIYLGSENWDPFIYLLFTITTYSVCEVF